MDARVCEREAAERVLRQCPLGFFGWKGLRANKGIRLLGYLPTAVIWPWSEWRNQEMRSFDKKKLLFLWSYCRNNLDQAHCVRSFENFIGLLCIIGLAWHFPPPGSRLLSLGWNKIIILITTTYIKTWKKSKDKRRARHGRGWHTVFGPSLNVCNSRPNICET